MGGDLPANKDNIFDGIDTSWNRIEGGKAIGDILYAVQNQYDFKNPSASIPELVRVYKAIQDLKDSHWKIIKTSEIKEIIAACAGLFLEVSSDTNHTAAGSSINLNIEVINRSDSHITLNSIVNPNGIQIDKNLKLDNNTSYDFKESLKINANQDVSTPYWLRKKGSLGMYAVTDKSLIGKPETPSALDVVFNLNIA